MSLYRCAACGSPNVVTDKTAGGVSYNYVKGAVGTVLLGAGGAAAGIESKTQQVFVCPDCGATLTYSMPDEIKLLIDMGVSSLDTRKNIVIPGESIPWTVIKSQYKNIESGAADDAEVKEEEKKRENINQFILERSIDYNKLKIATREPVIEEAKQVIKSMEENAKDPDILKEKYEKAIKDYNNTIENLDHEIVQLDKEIEAAQSELSNLGLFKRAKKEELRKTINDLTEKRNRKETAKSEKQKPREGDVDLEALKNNEIKYIAYRAIQHYGAMTAYQICRFVCLVLYGDPDSKVADLTKPVAHQIRLLKEEKLVCTIGVKLDRYFADAILYNCNPNSFMASADMIFDVDVPSSQDIKI